MIKDLLKNKNAKEQAKIKGQEIAKVDFRGEYISQEYGIKIDIQSIKTIESGVEVMARAWKGKKQLGFGADGSVEIERFRLINPPINTADGTTRIETYEKGIQATVNNFKEDPAQTIRNVIVHIASTHGQEDTQIVKGKAGNTVTAVYPLSGTGTAPIDGYAEQVYGSGETFASLRSGSGTGSNETGNKIWVSLHARNAVNPNLFEILRRSIIGFPTNAIGTDNVSIATISMHPTNLNTALGDTDISFTEVTPVDELSVENADYNIAKYADTHLVTGQAISTLDTGAYEVWILNATGRDYINGSGNTIFSMRLGFEIDDDFDNTYGGDWWTGIATSSADETAGGTDQDPLLTMTHSPPPTGPATLKTWNTITKA